jgi:hypothetical protein
MKLLSYIAFLLMAFIVPLIAASGDGNFLQKDFQFTIPPNYWVRLRVTYNASWEESATLRLVANDKALMANNNYYLDFNKHLAPDRPNRRITWGPWRDEDAKTRGLPTAFYLNSMHKEGEPTGNLPWKNTALRVVTPITDTPDKTVTYFVISWGHENFPTAVTIDGAYSLNKEALLRPSPFRFWDQLKHFSKPVTQRKR